MARPVIARLAIGIGFAGGFIEGAGRKRRSPCRRAPVGGATTSYAPASS
jgi:hypothetical protein